MFRKGSLVLLAGLALLAVAVPVWADDSNDAKTVFALEHSGFDARALGMGGAYVGVANDAAAGYWNPAGLYMMAEGATSLSSMYTTGLENDVFQNYVAVAHRFSNFALGATWVNTGVRDVLGYDGTGNYVNTFGLSENMVGLSAGMGTDKAAFGFTLKGYFQGLDSEQRNGVGLDAGVQFKVNDMLTLGGVMQDIGGNLGGDNRMPVTVRIGAGVFPMEHLRFALDVERTENQSTLFHGGGEYAVKFGDDAMAFLRAGVNDTKMNAGLGVKVSKLEADYAFTGEKVEGFGNAHRVSLNVHF
ncbi:MAG TPA: hypothetical protein VMS93_02585 [Candidatus Saccharimonadales bacterium]|nr:hypothetical protein [Candidatus Saccharimonadales bacterium]